jgi:poly [ADP-ribose] polymerase
LSVIHAFKLEREGEEKLFNPKNLRNRMLLWHGSIFSNFVGILSQGLKIAPPEAPDSG